MADLSIDDQRRAHGLAPLPPAATNEPDEEQPKCQHGCPTVPCRHTVTSVDPFLGRDRELRGIPLVGAGGGAIAGTRPGDDARSLMDEALELNEHGRLITQGKVRRSRRQDHRDDRIGT